MVGHASINALDNFLLCSSAPADLDADASGVRDSLFEFWQDINQDGIRQCGELHTFAALGVAGIKVIGSTSNTQPFSGSCTRRDVSTGERGVAEVTGSLRLANNFFYREFTDDPAVTASAAALPRMGGSGWTRDLREAMSLGTAEAGVLQSKVDAFAAATTRDAQMALLDGAIEAWCQTVMRVQGMQRVVHAISLPICYRKKSYERRYYLRNMAFLCQTSGTGGSPVPGYTIPPPTGQRTSTRATTTEAFSCKPTASFSSVPRLGICCPNSSREMKFRSRPAANASFSCDSPRSRRSSRSTSPNTVVTSLGGTEGRELLGVWDMPTIVGNLA